MKKTTIKIPDLVYVSAILYVCLMCLPILWTRAIVVNILAIAGFLCFFLGVLIRNHLTVNLMIALVLFFVFDYFLYITQWSNYYTLFNKTFMLSQFWVPLLIGTELCGNRRKVDLEKEKLLLYFFLILFSVTCLTTIIGNIRYEVPSRMLAGAAIGELGIKYRQENIGGFGFCYLILFVVPLLWNLFRKTKKNVLLIPLVLSLVCAFASQYFILILTLAFVILWTSFDKLSINKKILLSLLAVILIIIFVDNLDEIFEWLISVTSEQNSINRRIVEVYHTLKTGSTASSSDIFLRQEVYKKSWDSFLRDPLFGGWNNSILGGHSEIIDLLGSMGLFGLFLISTALFVVARGLKGFYISLSVQSKRMLFIMFFTFFLLSLLNPIFSSREIGLSFLLIVLFIDVSNNVMVKI